MCCVLCSARKYDNVHIPCNECLVTNFFFSHIYSIPTYRYLQVLRMCSFTFRNQETVMIMLYDNLLIIHSVMNLMHISLIVIYLLLLIEILLSCILYEV